MTVRQFFLCGAAALALVSCGKKDEDAPVSASSKAAASATAASPLDKPFTLKGGDELDVDRLLSLFPESIRPRYEKAAFDAKTGATVLTNITFIDRVPDDDVNISPMTIERAEFYGVDLDAVDRVKAGAAKSDAPMEPIFEKVRLFGLKGVDEANENDSEVLIGAVEFDRFRLRQGATKEAEDKSNLAHFFNAFDLAGLYVKGFDARGGDESSEADFGFVLPDMRFVGIGGGKLGAMIMNDAEITIRQSDAALGAAASAMGPQGQLLMNGPLKNFIAPGQQTSKFGSVEWRDIDFSGLMSWGLKNEKPPMTERKLINLGEMKIVDATTDINGKRFATAPLTTVSAMEFTWLAPSKVRSETKGATYDYTAYIGETEKNALDVLKKYKLDKVKADSSMSFDWDADKGGADFATAFASPGLADGDMKIGFGGLKLAEIAKLEAAGEAKPVQQAATFRNFSMTFDDERLLDAIFDLSALQTGGAGEDLRQSVPAMMRMTGMQLALMNPRFTSYIEALSGFIEKGGMLKVDAAPKEPVSLKTVMATAQTEPQKLVDVIDLKVTRSE